MITGGKLRRPIKSLLVGLVQTRGVSAIAAAVCSAIISLRPDSVRANVVMATACKSRGDFAGAGEAYLRAGGSAANPSRYRAAAVEMFLNAGFDEKATAAFAELARSARNENWFEGLERSVRAFCDHGQARHLESALESLDGPTGAGGPASPARLLLNLYDRPAGVPPGGPSPPASAANGSQYDVVLRHATAAKYARHSSGRGTSAIVDDFTLVPRALIEYRSIEPGDEPASKWQVARPDGLESVGSGLTDEVHVLAETGADLRSLQASADEVPHRFVIYAQDDQQAQEAGKLGMKVRSARDLVPDQAPITDVAYAHAERLSDWVLYRLSRRDDGDALTDLLKVHREALQTGLEDRIARAFLNLETVLAAAISSEGSGDFLLLAGGESTIVHCLPWMYSQADPRRVRLLAPFGKFKARRAFLRSVVNVAKSGARAPYGADAEGFGDAAAFRVSDQTLASWWKSLESQVRGSADRHCAGSFTAGNIMVAHLGDRNYGDANWMVAERLARDAPLFIIAASVLLTRKWEEAKSLGFPEAIRIQSLPEIFVEFMANRPPPKIFEDLFRLIMRDREWRSFTYRGEFVWQLLGRTLRDWFRRDLPRSVVDHMYIKAVCERIGNGVMVLSPGRARCARIAARIGRDLGIPSLDVQMLNTPEYRKYKPPVADVATVIDDMAGSAFERHFGIPAERLRVVGSPKLDMMRDEVKGHDRETVRREIALAARPGPVICFASQMQHLDHCLAIARILADHLRTAPGALVVKLHPREDDAREQAYVLALRDAPAGRAVVVREMDMTRLLAITDVLVTLYSNAAREALVLGRKVIVCNFTGEPWPLRFDVPGFATGAYSEAGLRAALEQAGVTSRPGGQEAAVAEQGSYIARNTHLLTGSATDRIAGIVGELRGVARGRA